MLTILHGQVLENERIALVATVVRHLELADIDFHVEAVLTLLYVQRYVFQVGQEHPLSVLVVCLYHTSRDLLLLRLEFEADPGYDELEAKLSDLRLTIIISLFYLFLLFLAR